MYILQRSLHGSACSARPCIRNSFMVWSQPQHASLTLVVPGCVGSCLRGCDVALQRCLLLAALYSAGRTLYSAGSCMVLTKVPPQRGPRLHIAGNAIMAYTSVGANSTALDTPQQLWLPSRRTPQRWQHPHGATKCWLLLRRARQRWQWWHGTPWGWLHLRSTGRASAVLMCQTVG
jgi:hypothetical protein